MKRYRIELGKYLLNFILAFIFIIAAASNIWAENQDDLTDCLTVKNDEQRRRCYDEIAGYESDKTVEASYLTKLWELDTEVPRGKYSLMPHRSNYILPLAYNSSPNKKPLQEASPGMDVEKNEVKFQISLKIKLWQDIFGQQMDLWFGYTQTSFWQLYNFDESAPFRETNYEPELLLNFRTNYRILGLKGRMFNLGFNHQSNGRSKPLSRSWNRIVGNLGLERGNFTLLLKAWYRIPESSKDDDNPDINDYMGPGEIWGYYLWKNNRFGIMLRNNFKTDKNKGAIQLEWCFPLSEKINGYIQYFRGYGESLLDHDHDVNRIGIGLILTHWK
ncbi:MAG: phospholipase A [Desulfobacterales bacterium]|nr:phospholipase A [Desulfobacterales bacterium]